MTTSPVVSRLPAALNAIATVGDPFTLRFELTLPVGAALTDGTMEMVDPDVDQPAIFVDLDAGIIEAVWSAEVSAEQRALTLGWVLLAAIDDAPLTSLVAGKLSWQRRGTPGAATTLDVPLTVNLGEIVVEVAATFAGPQGPPGAGVTGVGIDTITKITQAAYDLLDPPNPTTLYAIVG